MEIDKFTRQYLITALWASNDEFDENGGEPMDRNYSIDDIAPETLETMKADCSKFQVKNAADIASDLEMAGHDLWLTRSNSGAGYWDGDWAEPAATRLTDAAHRLGEFSLYIGDDGLIYGFQG